MKNSVSFKIARGFTPAVPSWKSKTLCAHQKGRDGVVNSGSRDGLCTQFLHAVRNPAGDRRGRFESNGSLANVFCRAYHRHWQRFPAAALGEFRESETVPTSQSRSEGSQASSAAARRPGRRVLSSPAKSGGRPQPLVSGHAGFLPVSAAEPGRRPLPKTLTNQLLAGSGRG